jgi:hypothetical protein
MPCHVSSVKRRPGTGAWPGRLTPHHPQIRVFKTHPDGVVSVKFKDIEPAQKCISLMHGRFFGGRRLEAALWDGFTNYSAKVRVCRFHALFVVALNDRPMGLLATAHFPGSALCPMLMVDQWQVVRAGPFTSPVRSVPDQR